jgi:hypothetical protein
MGTRSSRHIPKSRRSQRCCNRVPQAGPAVSPGPASSQIARQLRRHADEPAELSGCPRSGRRSLDWVRRLGVSPIRRVATDSSVIAVGADRLGGPADKLGHVGSRRVAVESHHGGDRPQPAIDRRSRCRDYRRPRACPWHLRHAAACTSEARAPSGLPAPRSRLRTCLGVSLIRLSVCALTLEVKRTGATADAVLMRRQSCRTTRTQA